MNEKEIERLKCCGNCRRYYECDDGYGRCGCDLCESWGPKE